MMWKQGGLRANIFLCREEMKQSVGSLLVKLLFSQFILPSHKSE